MSAPATPADHGAGRVLRGGRVLARLLLTWLADTAAIVLLDEWLSGFEMSRWWQPPVAALLLGVLVTVGWPLVLRLALPLALVTLGLGSFVLLGVGVLAVFAAIPGVMVTSLKTSIVVAVVLAGVSAAVSSLLAIDEDEVFFRRARRTGRRAGAAASGDPVVPGVLFLQVDGLGYDTARRAVRDGSMPTLAAWLRSDSHVLTGWHTDWSSQTGASVCGILHGDNSDVLGFRWYEKDRDHVLAVSHPADAAEVERRHSNGRGLLAGDGASRGNLFSGDAPYVSFTMSSLAGLEKAATRRARRRRSRQVGVGYRTYFANPANVLRTLGGSVLDVGRELSAAARQRRADVRPRISRGGLYPLLRPGTTVIARDVVVSALIEDMLAGRPVVYADFLGYDEVAHHSGIERFDALEVLRGIDQQIGRLYRATQLAPRPYHLVCLSDHGQTQGWAFAERFGESIGSVVGRLCGAPAPRPSGPCAPTSARRTTEGWQAASVVAESTPGGGFVARRLRARVGVTGSAEEWPRTEDGARPAVPRVAPGVVCTVSGHTAMVSFPDLPGRVPLETIERRWPDLLPGLVDHDGVGFLLVHSEEFGPVVLGRDGLRRLATNVVIGADPLAGYGEHAARLVARVSTFPHCADVMINSRYDPETDEASPFEPHVGSHGGLGGPQQHGFLLHPRSFAPAGEIVGAEHLHRVLRGWLTDLGQPEPGEPAGAGPAVTRTRESAADRT